MMKYIKLNWLKFTLLACCFAALLALSFYVKAVVMRAPTDINDPHEKPFVVVIPSYNNKKWYQRNLDSVLSQEYHNFRVIFVDDASPDGTGNLVQEYIKERGQAHRVTLIQNEKRAGALANNYKAIWLCNPREIVVELDGDDWIENPHVLQYLNKLYQDPDVWMTYGQFIYHPDSIIGWTAEVPKEVVASNSFREHRWLTTHLRTFYAGLFQKINKEDLLLDGEFFPMAGDLAHMFPIVEMAGKHSRFIPDILYVYNVDTQMNDHYQDPNYQDKLGMIIRYRKKYLPIDKPW